MRQTVHILSIVLIIFSLASSGALAQGPALTADDPTPPSSPVKLIFVHHSTGENWLADGNGNLGVTLRNNNYFVSDTNYGWGPDSIGDRTDLGHWWDWFRGEDSATYLAALYAESGQHSSYSRLAADPGGPNEIILFKSCFPNSAIGGNPTDPPTVGDNPMRGEWCCGESYTVGNVKGIYNDILQYFATRQDKLFVVIVTPPLTSGSTDASQAANARALANWLVNDWLDGYAYQNVAVFDFYNVLTSNGGSTNVNDLGATNGNHHRWRNGAVEHTKTVNSNYSAYGSSSGDSHPTAAGNQKASAEFAPLLNVFYHRWKASGPTSFGAPTIWLRNYARSAGGWTSQDVYPRMVGDVNGDGRADLVGCGSKGVYVALSTGSAFGAPSLWSNTFGKSAGGWTSQNTYPRMLGDVNGDGRADMVGCGNKGVYVALSTGSAFGAPALWSNNLRTLAGGWTSQNTYPRMLGDVNGDGRADMVGCGNKGVYVALSTGSAFGTPTLWLNNLGTSAGGWTSQDVYPRMVGDVNGDGRADMVGCGSKGVYVALSTGSTFGAPALWINTFGKSAGGWTSQNTYPRMVGDVNNDGRADMVGCGNKGVYVALSTGSTFGAPALWVQQFGPSVGDWPNQNETPRVVGDANGDGRADVIGFGANGVQVALSTGSAFGAPTQWIATYGKSSGGWTSQDLYPRAVGDADGDGDADVVGFGNAGTYVSPAE